MTKAVVWNDGVVSSYIIPTAPGQRELAYKVMKEVLDRSNTSFRTITSIVATGYGRLNVPFANKQVTEISCHAKGAAFIFPSARTVIDIGGQDCKGIRIDDGRPIDFVMNDKCAAGTGRFLEIIAEALGLKIGEMGEIALKSKFPAKISSTCTVFAEQEVVARLAEGVDLNDLVAGIHISLIDRVYRMVKRLGIVEDVVFTGGGAKNPGLISIMGGKLGYAPLVPPEPLLTGAIGAALIARDVALQN